jgi:hypothetical protein
MQARFVSLRVTETWQMVEGRNPDAMTPAGTIPAAREVAARAAEPPHELEPTRRPVPVHVD